MSIGQEYTVCFNTANRNQVVYPEPNNFELNLFSSSSSSGIPPAVQMYLGSVELPTTQWTVEPSWQTISFDQGISTAINGVGEEENALFTFSVNGTVVQAAVPPTLNPTTAIVPGAPNEVTITTQYPHGLASRSGWSPITLEGTSLTDESVKNLNTNPTLTIINDTTFMLTNLPAPLMGTSGYVLATPPSPTELAAGLTAAITDALATAFPTVAIIASVSYDANTNLFTLSVDTGDASALVMLAHGVPSLPNLMGFPLNSMLQSVSGTTALTTTGNYSDSLCLSTLTLRPGNYTAQEFAAEFERAWNPFVFNGGVAANPADRPVFAFTNATGASFTFPIEYGTYTPDSFAAFLATEMNTADPSQTYSVTYMAANQTLQLTSTLPFGLPFDDPAVTPSLVSRMGFEAVYYSGSAGYTSMSLGYAPSTCSSVPAFRNGNLRVLINETTSSYVFQFSGSGCQTGTVAVVGTQGTVGPLPQAHGLMVGNFVTLSTTTTSTTLPVVAVPDPFTITVDLFGSAIMNGDMVTVCNSATQQGSLNLYLASNPMLAEVMGFPATSVFSESDGVLEAPYCWNLNGPAYLLWVIGEPSGSTFIQHYWRAKDDNKVDIFAKLILRNNTYSIERLYPMQQVMQGNKKVTKLRMMMCNPDHSPYNFHGKNWSGTLVFVTASVPGALGCY